MQEERQEGPSFPKPWYYRPEFMIPMFILWPSGSLLAIRSPWNSNVMFGGMAWAFLIIGGVMGVRWLSDGIYQPIFTFYLPGILLTLITQVQWAVYRSQMTEEDESSDQEMPELEGIDQPRPSARRRRRIPRSRN